MDVPRTGLVRGSSPEGSRTGTGPDLKALDATYRDGDPQFIVERQERGLFCIYDRVQGFETDIHESRLQWGFFSIGKWFAERCAENLALANPWNHAQEWVKSREWGPTTMGVRARMIQAGKHGWMDSLEPTEEAIELAGIQVDRNKYPALQQNAAQVKGKQ